MEFISFEVITYSEKETIEFAEKVSYFFEGVVAFFADMGAGKTAFVRGVAKRFKADEKVYSPTFSIVNEYYVNYLNIEKIIHCDMCRVKTQDELYTTGFFDFIEDGNSLILIEWSENIVDFLPFTHFKVYIDVLDETKRKIKIVKENSYENSSNRKQL